MSHGQKNRFYQNDILKFTEFGKMRAKKLRYLWKMKEIMFAKAKFLKK